MTVEMRRGGLQGKPQNVGLPASTICGNIPAMITASELADALGRSNIAEACGVGATAVSNAVVRGWFPSSWYLACSALADKKPIQCPPELFKMKTADSSQYVDNRDSSGLENQTGGAA